MSEMEDKYPNGFPCDTGGKPVGKIMSQICADCCEKDHPEWNQISNESIQELQSYYETAYGRLMEILRGTVGHIVYNQDAPNANHFSDVQELAKQINGLMRNVLGTINKNPQRDWGFIPVDSYDLEKVAKMLKELRIDIDDPKVRKNLRHARGDYE